MPTGRSTADVLIIGGGVIGLTTAYALARDGARVTLLDRQDFGRESSWAGAGIISPGNPVQAWETAGSGIMAAVTHGGRQVANQYLLCAGAWSDELLRPFGVRTEVRPVRGQIALLNTRAPGPAKVLIRGKRYVVPRG